MQDGNNNDLFLSFEAQCASRIQNGCSSLINTTKKPCKGFCSESKWAPTNLTNQTKSIVSCVTLINVLYTSLTPPNQIVWLSGARYYHAEVFLRQYIFSIVESARCDSPPVCLPLTWAFAALVWKKYNIQRRKRRFIYITNCTAHIEITCFQCSVISRSLSRLEGRDPGLDHQSIERKVLIWMRIHHCPSYVFWTPPAPSIKP